MNLPKGSELHYIIGREAWYADACLPSNPQPHLSVMAQFPGDGVAWEFQFTEHSYNGGCIRIEMFDDSFDAYAQVPELFAALTHHAPTSLATLVAILDELGAKDATPRVHASSR